MNITTAAHFASAITPRDFATKRNEAGREHTFDGGAMRHLIAALAGQRVVVVLGGQALLQAELLSLRSYPGRSQEVLVREYWTAADGTPGTQATWYAIDKVQTIIEIESGVGTRSARFVAQDTLRTEQQAGIAQVRAAHPECSYGKWEASSLTVGEGEVDVTFDPQRADGGPRHYERVRVAQAVSA